MVAHHPENAAGSPVDTLENCRKTVEELTISRASARRVGWLVA